MRPFRARGFLIAVLVGVPSAAHAQAWLPPRGEATLALGYQYLDGRDHLTLDGANLDRGRMKWNILGLDLGYGITDRFAVRVGLPFVVSNYVGAYPHYPIGRPSIDDGGWHLTVQDLRLEARFLATTGALAITPFVGGTLPLRDYETHAHAAPGKGLWEATAGVLAGRRFDPVLPDGFAQLRASFTVPERPLGVWHNRTNATLDLGYFVTPSLLVRATGSWQKTHGGYRFPIDAPPGTVAFQHHDQLLREDYLQAGMGASLTVSGSVDLFASAFNTLGGKNSVRMRGAAFGFVWGFSPARMVRGRPSDAP